MSQQILVVQYEQFFPVNDVGDLPEAIRQGLERLREYAGARIVGSYVTVEDNDFIEKGVSHLTLGAPVNIEVD